MIVNCMRGLMAALILIPLTIAQAADLYLPRTRVHIKCHFADGSYVEYKKREKWLFYAELFPHAQTTGTLDSTLKYVDVKGKIHDNVGTSELDCLGVGKRDGRVFWRDGFEDLQHRMIYFSFPPAGPGEISIEGMPRTSRAPRLQLKLAELKAKESVDDSRTPMVVPLNSGQLLLEQPLTTSDRSYPFETVVYVLQARSNDFGKTWTEPIITKNAELYEIGRTVKGQSWAPRLQEIVRDRSVH